MATDIGIAAEEIADWQSFTNAIEQLENSGTGRWIYRGQSQDWDLATSLERRLTKWNIPLKEATGIEAQLHREFKRRYQGTDLDEAKRDRLYCFALMQHHGAPTRLLDCTYSPFVAAQNAIKDGADSPDCVHVVWCFNGPWCARAATAVAGEELVKARADDATRNDATFIPLFQATPPKTFILYANALQLNERLSIQRGIFLCPGNIETTFLENLCAMQDFQSKECVVKLLLKFDYARRLHFARKLRMMNISEAALFPGLDGFSRSLGEHVFHYRELVGDKHEEE
jgi:FRG domain